MNAPADLQLPATLEASEPPEARGISPDAVPVLVGASRKGMIARVLGPGLENRLDGSLALAALCVAREARVVRVRDIQDTI